MKTSVKTSAIGSVAPHEGSWPAVSGGGALALFSIAVLGVALSVLMFLQLFEDHRRLVTAEFERAATDRIRVIEEGFEASVELLAATGAYLVVAERIDPDQFVRFARTLLARRGGVTAIGWVPRVPRAERSRFETEVRRRIEEFRITESGADGLDPAGDRADYFPVLDISPVSGNESAVGFDLGSERVRRAALEAAWESGEVRATGRIRLVQEPEDQFSILVFYPLYRPDAALESAPERRRHLIGLVSEVLRIGDVVEHALSVLEPAGVDVSVYDTSGDDGERFLFHHVSRLRLDRSPGAAEPASRSELTKVREFDLAGRSWRLALSNVDEVRSTDAPPSSWIALAGGLAFTALLVAYVHLVQRRAQQLAVDQRVLEARVRERTAELEQTQAELIRAERLAVLGELTGTVAHELRNPLSTIHMSLELIRRRLSQETDFANVLDRAERNIERCDRIITELLDFARVSPLLFEPVCVDGWIEAFLDEYRPPGGVPVRASLNAGGTSAVLDVELLRRALVNLLDNACQASMADGVDTDAGEALPGAEVVLSTERDGDWIRIVVRDHGTGIPADLERQIFEPLFSTKTFGVGLGLPTVRRVAEQHHGTIELDAAPGAGTVAVLRLPLTHAPRPAGSETPVR